ncbi:proton-coupled folate transporter-like [Paramacrobiotus metropolitanus]|uniref:proton-coupled folate transporter-like n=1 Tax=Paramacrobiotus metropolitanus TaxID=2943436 RepID=UPI002445F901|nr:proton-coupled folate transporter-like [Paramacrobiotus metropolitanus]
MPMKGFEYTGGCNFDSSALYVIDSRSCRFVPKRAPHGYNCRNQAKSPFSDQPPGDRRKSKVVSNVVCLRTIKRSRKQYSIISSSEDEKDACEPAAHVDVMAKEVDHINYPRFIHNPALLTIPVVLLFGLSFGVSQPVYTELIKDRVCEIILGYPKELCEDNKLSANRHAEDSVRTLASNYVFYRNLVMSLPCVLLSQFIGQWSDKYGRKVPMLMPFLGLFLCGVILLLCAYLPIHPMYMLFASLLAACLGGWMMFPMALFAYIGDYTNESNRTLIMGIAAGVQAIGNTAGMLIGGTLLHHYGFAVPFYLFCALHVASFIYVVIFVKDRREFPQPLTFKLETFTSLFNWANLKDNLHTLRRKRTGNTRLHFGLLIICVLISATCIDGEPQVFQLFVEFAPLRWNVEEFSTFTAIQGAIAGGLMPILFLVFKKNLAMKDTAIGIISILSAIVCSFGYSLAHKSWIVFVAAAVGILRGLHAVAARSILTGRVEKSEIGKMMAITSSIQALSPTLTGGILLNVFGATAGFWPGFCFALSAWCFIFSLVSFCYIDVDRRKAQYGENGK